MENEWKGKMWKKKEGEERRWVEINDPAHARPGEGRGSDQSNTEPHTGRLVATEGLLCQVQSSQPDLTSPSQVEAGFALTAVL